MLLSSSSLAPVTSSAEATSRGELLAFARSPQQDGAPWGICVTGEPGSGKKAPLRASAPGTRAGRLGSAALPCGRYQHAQRPGRCDAADLPRIEELGTHLQITPSLAENASAEDIEKTFAELPAGHRSSGGLSC